MRAWAIPVCLLFALATFVCGVIFMPTAELIPATVQSGPWSPGLSPVRSYDAMLVFKGLGDMLTQTFFGIPNVADAVKNPMHDGIPGDVRSYVLYSVFLALAMVCAAIALNAVGRWDSEEKTIIPFKK